MIVISLSFLAGVLALQFLPVLPHVGCSWLIPLLLVGGLRWGRRPKYLLVAVPMILLCGFLWAALAAHMRLGPQLDPALEGTDLVLTGVVASLPEAQDERVRFLFDIDSIDATGRVANSPGRVRLSWYGEQRPGVGERWRLLVRLKRPHGFMNPGGFDYEGWLFQQGIRATGYVRESPLNGRLGGAVTRPVDRLRQGIRSRLLALLADRPDAAALFVALSVGDRAAIGRDLWDIFVATGTSHLIAISGLHVGIVAGLGFWLVQWLWRRSSRLLLRCPAQIAAGFGAFIFAFAYSALAGFSLPTLRALLMLSVVLGTLLQRREPAPYQSLSLALLAVLLYDPLSVLSPGFWLSFTAVFIILFSLYGRFIRKGPHAWVRVQWMVVVGLLPVLLLSGMTLSLVAPLVNLLLIPLFSLLLVPLVLIGLVLLGVWPGLAEPVIQWVGVSLDLCIRLLGWVADQPHVTRTLEGLDWQASLMLLGGTVLLLLPAALGGRLPGLALLLTPFIWPVQPPSEERLHLTLLDVGQGLAMVVETAQHLLVYDTGPRFSEHSDAAASVLVPYLKWRGHQRIDRLILSNADGDHAGGYRTLRSSLPILETYSGEAARLRSEGTAVSQCVRGVSWEWDGVEFDILSPEEESTWQGNDASCVLRITTGDKRFLLTGDIGERVERMLLERETAGLGASVVLIPHHGSLSSSSAGFVELTSPDYALVSAGYRNRYGFPKAQVMERWRNSGARLLNTADSGAISLRVDSAGRLHAPARYRERARRYWHD